jgi:hypothetical protein
MLREAAVDYRHNSLRNFRVRHRAAEAPFRRIALQVSAARGVRPVEPLPAGEREEHRLLPAAAITSDGRGKEGGGWRAEVDYVLGDPPCVNKCFYADFVRRICAGHEWQVIVSIVGPPGVSTDAELDAALDRLAADRAPSLELSLPIMVPGSGDAVPAHFSLALGCISGLLPAAGTESLSATMPHMPPPAEACSNSVGSVVVSGGALFGYKRNSRSGRKEAANFAARALLGSVRFDTVAVAVIANHSVSEIQARCGDDGPACATAYHDGNDRFMANLAAEVEDELSALGVPRREWARVVLFPVCRLGTDFDGFERDGHGCRWSAFYGQWLVNDHSYTLFSPYHKWYASFDLDEFVVDEEAYVASTRRPHRRVEPRRAADLFDERELLSSRRGALRMPWLDFAVRRSQTTNLSLDVLEHGGVDMVSTAVGTAEALNRSTCLQRGTAGGGKPVLSCSNGGIGIHVHDSLRLDRPDDMASRVCNGGLRFDSKLALYHAHGPRFGDCTYRLFQRGSPGA